MLATLTIHTYIHTYIVIYLLLSLKRILLLWVALFWRVPHFAIVICVQGIRSFGNSHSVIDFESPEKIAGKSWNLQILSDCGIW